MCPGQHWFLSLHGWDPFPAFLQQLRCRHHRPELILPLGLTSLALESHPQIQPCNSNPKDNPKPKLYTARCGGLPQDVASPSPLWLQQAIQY